ncbi:hypothetical protein BDW62DRAFT_209975 [Aspergillus aurantiobrunneus]
MRTNTLLSLLSAATAVVSEQYATRKVYQLDPGTWIENVAQRGSSWYTRLTCDDRPEVLEVDPSHQHGGPRSIYTFAEATNATGIAELSADKYGVLTLNETADGITVSIWTLETSGPEPTATTIIENIDNVELLNGLTAISSNIVLAADSPDGGIYRINLATRTADKVLSGDSYAFSPGVNGLGYKEPYLYYTNTFKGLFGRILVDASTGSPAGLAEVLASGDILVGADDFALAYWTETAFVANIEKNTVVRIDLDNGAAEVVVEGIPAPTTATFGTSGGLYVATSGRGKDGGASIWAIEVPDETLA